MKVFSVDQKPVYVSEPEQFLSSFFFFPQRVLTTLRQNNNFISSKFGFKLRLRNNVTVRQWVINGSFLLQLLHKHQLLLGAESQANPCSQPSCDRTTAHLQKCKCTTLIDAPDVPGCWADKMASSKIYQFKSVRVSSVDFWFLHWTYTWKIHQHEMIHHLNK